MRRDDDEPIEMTVAAVIAEVEWFAKGVHVHATLDAWKPFGAISGLELTDLFADEPGKGAGSLVMKKLHEIADDIRLPVYLRPSGLDSRRFYERHGYVQARGLFAPHLVRFPELAQDDEDEKEMINPRQSA